MTTELTTTRDRVRGVRGERGSSTRTRTPNGTRYVARRLRYLARAIRREQEERGVAYAPAETPAQRQLYQALIEAEVLLAEIKSGQWRYNEPGPGVAVATALPG